MIKQHPLMRPPAFDAHIAIPRTRNFKKILAALEAKGVTIELDYFRKVVNLDRGISTGPAMKFACSTPTGHDLHDPHGMLTLKGNNYSVLLAAIKECLSIVSKYLSTGDQTWHFNFELERFLSSRQLGLTNVDAATDFPGYHQVHDAPLFENHIGWHGDVLPGDAEIISRLVKLTGITPHQIVDFSLLPFGLVVDRVITYYQQDLVATMEFGEVLRVACRQLGAAYVISEQVCFVGEPIR
ncbi:MAG: hypothetical protein Q7S22_03420 [Candidatus Micrarchaeota archaeon]|nr:hypothetical protein [Candidatus Micrarchaeota archaeon]